MFFRRQIAAALPPQLPASLPAGLRAYAVGDIHGRDDLLAQLLELIADDHRSRADSQQGVLILLGDYIDRGLHSRDVIARIIADPLPGMRLHCLRGNHEDALLQFLLDPAANAAWLSFGGLATLNSYGVHLRPGTTPTVLRDQLLEKIPPDHLEFFRSLPTSLHLGDYFFAHAGVRPGIPLSHQRDQDLMWIRDGFLSSDAQHGAIVVHGHSISFEPQERGNRISIDTGAFATGVLTALGLQEEARWFLRTG